MFDHGNGTHAKRGDGGWSTGAIVSKADRRASDSAIDAIQSSGWKRWQHGNNFGQPIVKQWINQQVAIGSQLLSRTVLWQFQQPLLRSTVRVLLSRS